MTITEFLEARIAEDEVAVDVGGIFRDPREPGWMHEDTPLQRWDYDEMMIGPARVLAECEAKRRIVEISSEDDDHPNALLVRGRVLAVLARVYAGHPDYDQAWAL